MSCTAYLSTSDDLPRHDAASPELQLSMGGIIPPFWLALFDIGSFSTPSETAGWPLLSSDRVEAVTRLRCRNEHLLAVFGGQASGVLDALAAKLTMLESKLLILDSSDMGMQFSDSPEQWRGQLQVMLSAFKSTPLVPTPWPRRLLGAAAVMCNEGWRAYFTRFDRMQQLASSHRFSPQDLAGGAEDGDMPWE